MVGDSSNDAQAARAAGYPVQVTYGYNTVSRCAPVDADGFARFAGGAGLSRGSGRALPSRASLSFQSRRVGARPDAHHGVVELRLLERLALGLAPMVMTVPAPGIH